MSSLLSSIKNNSVPERECRNHKSNRPDCGKSLRLKQRQHHVTGELYAAPARLASTGSSNDA
jgi:hypothetical protein